MRLKEVVESPYIFYSFLFVFFFFFTIFLNEIKILIVLNLV